ncbi:MAG: hypothetical protein RIR69_1230, partial [Actinomycetota bacterium]
ATLEVGQSTHSLLLEPTGHIVALLRVVRHEEYHYTLDVDAGFGQSLIDRLKRFVLRSDVTMEMSNWCVRAFRGHDIAAIDSTEHAVVPAYRRRESGVDLLGARETLPTVGDATEPEHIDMFRVDAHWPRLGVDVLVGDIPATSGVLDVAVSFSKGCYPGQELVERMDSRGSQAPVVVRSFPRDGMAVGARIQHNGTDIGTVTSIGFTRAIGRVSRQSDFGEPLS